MRRTGVLIPLLIALLIPSRRVKALAMALAFVLGLAASAPAQAGNAALPAAGAGAGNAALPAAGAGAGNAALPAAGALAVKRLILTDGSYQAATEWKKAGDRVQYFSAERGEWEELPVALVDWKATEEWNAAAAKNQEEALKQEIGEQIAARKEAELNTPQVLPQLAPELRLPAEGGVFLLEQRAGKPVLQQVEGNKPQENDHEEKNLLKRSIIPLPLASRLQTIELAGAAAKIRVKSAAPSIFVDVENNQGPIAGGYFQIVRLERKRALRVVATNKIGMGGEEKVKEMFLRSRAEKFSGDWWKLIPLEELTPGEYAIVISGGGGDDNGVVWDFGVDQ